MKNHCFLFFTLILISAQSISQEQNFLDKPYLKTAATFTTEVMPDKIFLAILITENDTNGKISVEELETKMISKLKSLGIDITTQLKLTNLTSDFKKYFLRKKDVLKNKLYSLLVYDAETAGKVIRKLELINISNIDLIKTEYSKLEELKIELKGKAVGKAKRQAESMLSSLNQKVGKAIFISDSKSDTSRLLRSVPSGSNSTNFYIEPDLESKGIEFNKTTVRVEVVVYFEIL